MKASALRNRVTVHEPISAASPMGGSGSTTWTPTHTLSANFTPLSVKDVINAQAADSETRARCVMRYRTDITSKMRIEHRGKMYAIDGDPLPDDHSGLEYITLMLKSVK